MKEPDVERVLSFIDDARLVRLAQALVRIDTQNPPGNEASLAAFAAQYLGGCRLARKIQEVKPGRANLLARLGPQDGVTTNAERSHAHHHKRIVRIQGGREPWHRLRARRVSSCVS